MLHVNIDVSMSKGDCLPIYVNIFLNGTPLALFRSLAINHLSFYPLYESGVKTAFI
jgi:hypothetical protein